MHKLRVMLENRRPTDALNVIDCGCETDRASDVWRPAFEPMRRFLECALFERDAYDHFAPAVPRRHRIQKLRASVKRADASWCTHFVSGECKKITTEFLHVERHVSGTLCRVDQRHRAHLTSFSTKFGDWINCPERIRDVRECKKFHFWSQQGRKLFNIKSSVVAHRQKSKTRAFAFRQQLPWHQVAVMLHYSQKNHILFANEFFAPRLRHQIDALRCAAGEDDLVGT